MFIVIFPNHYLASFGWIIYHGVDVSKCSVVNGTDWFPSHVRRDLHEEKIVVSQAVLMRKYQYFGAVLEVSNMVERGVWRYEL